MQNFTLNIVNFFRVWTSLSQRNSLHKDQAHAKFLLKNNALQRSDNFCLILLNDGRFFAAAAIKSFHTKMFGIFRVQFSIVCIYCIDQIVCSRHNDDGSKVKPTLCNCLAFGKWFRARLKCLRFGIISFAFACSFFQNLFNEFDAIVFDFHVKTISTFLFFPRSFSFPRNVCIHFVSLLHSKQSHKIYFASRKHWANKRHWIRCQNKNKNIDTMSNEVHLYFFVRFFLTNKICRRWKKNQRWHFEWIGARWLRTRAICNRWSKCSKSLLGFGRSVARLILKMWPQSFEIRMEWCRSLYRNHKGKCSCLGFLVWAGMAQRPLDL